MVFVLEEYVIAIPGTQDKIVPLRAVLQMNFIILQHIYVELVVLQALIKTYIQELAFLVPQRVVNV